MGVETWYYQAADSVFMNGDLSASYWNGMKVLLVQGGFSKYFVIVDVTVGIDTTTITLDGGGFYNVADASITSHQVCIWDAPPGWPMDVKFEGRLRGDEPLQLTVLTTPTSPPSGFMKVYAKDGRLYGLSSAGREVLIGPHAIVLPAGDVVGTTAEQALTNKTFDDEITQKQLETPNVNPAAGYTKIYFKSDKKLYGLMSDGTETLIGPYSGVGTGNVLGPDNNSDGWIPTWAGDDSRTLGAGLPLSAIYSTVFALAQSADINIATGMGQAFFAPFGAPVPLADAVYSLNVANGGYIIIR